MSNHVCIISSYCISCGSQICNICTQHIDNRLCENCMLTCDNCDKQHYILSECNNCSQLVCENCNYQGRCLQCFIVRKKFIIGPASSSYSDCDHHKLSNVSCVNCIKRICMDCTNIIDNSKIICDQCINQCQTCIRKCDSSKWCTIHKPMFCPCCTNYTQLSSCALCVDCHTCKFCYNPLIDNLNSKLIITTILCLKKIPRPLRIKILTDCF